MKYSRDLRSLPESDGKRNRDCWGVSNGNGTGSDGRGQGLPGNVGE